jgi:hypothetical protein
LWSFPLETGLSTLESLRVRVGEVASWISVSL